MFEGSGSKVDESLDERGFKELLDRGVSDEKIFCWFVKFRDGREYKLYTGVGDTFISVLMRLMCVARCNVPSASYDDVVTLTRRDLRLNPDFPKKGY